MSEHFEQTDVASGNVARVGGYLAVTVTLIAIGISYFLQLLQGKPTRSAETEPPPPRLQVSEGVDLAKLRSREAEALTTYRWVDRKQGIVAIPIERAIDLTVGRGLPARSAP